ncbi:MAG: single-stranded-DNA-specific exonuclease RecJ [Clostridia bacterium]|nr:single-stranded-DNA-specific exonuclease RecJ [Clostridia bacterium]
MSRKKWNVCALDKELASDIAQEYDIDPFTALLLTSRGITDDEEIEEFFSDGGRLSDPFEIKDMDKAVARINLALEKDELIAVYGDYDADGVTATALLYSYLQLNGFRVISYIPDRNSEGYGLNKQAIKSLFDKGVNLIVTVDNGVSAYDETEYIKELGMDIVITDHHKVPERLPKAAAVVDPHRPDCPSMFKQWAGVGVAFKLICALSEGEEQELLSMFSDLVTIGTIGDIVSLTGENRTIVKHGLRAINEGNNLGIEYLKKVAGMEGKTLGATSVAFSLVPRINAIGRTGHASEALKLLLSEDIETAEKQADLVDKSNANRQELEKEIALEAQKQIENNPEMLNNRVLIFSGKNWHGGVIGIVAARLVQKYGKPCLVITDDGVEAKGSARSIDGFSLYDAISSCSELLSHYGGHVLAAGFGMKSENLPEFKKAIEEYAKKVQMPFPTVELDCKLRPEFINSDILDVIASLEPFGAGNPQPLFGLFGMRLHAISPIGGGKHLRLTFKRGESTITALLFGTAQSEFPYLVGDTLDLAVRLERNEYMGQVKVSVYIKDIRMSGTDDEKFLKSVRLYEKIKRKDHLTEKEAAFALPSRQFTGEVYRFIRDSGGWKHDTDVLCYRLNDDGANACKVLISIDALCELGILKNDRGNITLADTQKKVNLDNSALLSYLKNYKDNI